VSNFTEVKSPIGTISRTGASCPQNGTWRAIGQPAKLMPIRRGVKMPYSNGRAVQWKLVRYQ